MNLLRKILFPFAILYGFIISIRNFLFDTGILKSYSFDLPVIAVGNLSVGGTGKTPQIECLFRCLAINTKILRLILKKLGLSNEYKVCYLTAFSKNNLILLN